MTTPTGRGGREEEDDQDLLTFGEVRARVTEELDKERGHLAELERSGASEPLLAATRTRIEQLIAAAERNSRGASRASFVEFFGFEPRRDSH